jgi:hypothetical protein
LFHPAPFATGVNTIDIVGLVASRLTVTDCVFVPPALVAAQSYVVPDESVDSVVVPHPVDEAIVDSVSETDHDTITLDVYQPLPPTVPDTFGVTRGGVVSATTVIVNVMALTVPVIADWSPWAEGGVSVPSE